MRQMWNGGNSNTPNNRMPRIRRAENSDTRKTKSREESIRVLPIYKILEFAEGTERWKTREPG